MKRSKIVIWKHILISTFLCLNAQSLFDTLCGTLAYWNRGGILMLRQYVALCLSISNSRLSAS